MKPRIFDGCAAAFGRGTARLAVLGIVLGAVGLIAGCLSGRAGTSLGVLAASWLFCAGLAAGSVAFSASIRVSEGGWAREVLPLAEAPAGFFVPALVLLAILVLFARSWIPTGMDGTELAWRAGRDLLASTLLFGVGARYVRRVARGQEAGREAVIYLLLYAATLSLWAVDLVMDLHAWAPSTVIPPLYFAGAFLSGIAWTGLAGTLRSNASSDTRNDIGKLLFAFVIFWGYLMWAAYLPTWYGNLSDETGQLLARWNGGWKLLTLPVIFAVLVFPFVFLMPEHTKRGQRTLGFASAVILLGLLGERFLLVLPSLVLSGGLGSLLAGAGITLGVIGLFVLSTGARVSVGTV